MGRLIIITGIFTGRRYKKLTNKYNLSGKTNRRKFCDEYKPKIISLLNDGALNQKDIANNLGIDYSLNQRSITGVKEQYLGKGYGGRNVI